mmetsp:Transcript_3996/g.16282  ORF Transcript_3996/g.16282 Transcript_3996/m.16282 type:complete len:221 (+) Transcript_3996:34-696(+)
MICYEGTCYTANSRRNTQINAMFLSLRPATAIARALSFFILSRRLVFFESSSVTVSEGGVHMPSSEQTLWASSMYLPAACTSSGPYVSMAASHVADMSKAAAYFSHAFSASFRRLRTVALLVMAAWRDSTPNSHLRQSVEGGGAGASTADPRSMTSRSDAGTSGGSVSARVSPSFGASSGHSFASAQSTSGVKSVLITSMAFWMYISRRLSHMASCFVPA